MFGDPPSFTPSYFGSWILPLVVLVGTILTLRHLPPSRRTLVAFLFLGATFLTLQIGRSPLLSAHMLMLLCVGCRIAPAYPQELIHHSTFTQSRNGRSICLF